MLLGFKRLPIQSFVMFDEERNCLYSTWHYELTIRKRAWFGLLDKTYTEKTHWNASSPDLIEKQLKERIGKWY